jgi:hypothetical protein
MIWEGHVARMGEERGVYRVFIGKPEIKKPLGRIMLGWIFRKWDVVVWTGLGWLRIDSGGEKL